MTDDTLIRIEPNDRIAVLARTLQVSDPLAEKRLVIGNDNGIGEPYIGRALYRHQSIYQGLSTAPAWSHLELTYFRDIVPTDVIRTLALTQPPEDTHMLRAEILLTTPSSFVVPRGWQGSEGRSDRKISLEYVNVNPTHMAAYRNIMKRYVGPSAAKLVASGRFGTFRAMETLVILFQDSSLVTDWNQIHLCEFDNANFKGFGQEFDAVLQEVSPGGGFAGVFAGLGPMRTISRWTFNDAVVEADLTLGMIGSFDSVHQQL